MSKLGKLGHFFQQVGKFAPLVLMATPLAPIAPAVSAAIQEAEAIHGPGTGAEKLAHVVAVAKDAAVVAQQAGAPVDPQAVEQAAAETISAVIAVVKASKPRQA